MFQLAIKHAQGESWARGPKEHFTFQRVFKLHLGAEWIKVEKNGVVLGEVGPWTTSLKRRGAQEYTQHGQKCQESVLSGYSCHLFEQAWRPASFQMGEGLAICCAKKKKKKSYIRAASSKQAELIAV